MARQGKNHLFHRKTYTWKTFNPQTQFLEEVSSDFFITQLGAECYDTEEPLVLYFWHQLSILFSNFQIMMLDNHQEQLKSTTEV